MAGAGRGWYNADNRSHAMTHSLGCLAFVGGCFALVIAAILVGGLVVLA